MSKLEIRSEGSTIVTARRYFAAKPEAVFRAHTDPKILPRWLTGPEGWSMPACICDARPGGKFRYEFKNGHGHGFFIDGTFVEIDAPNRIVHLERMHLPDPTPECRVESDFTPEGKGTMLNLRMIFKDQASRDGMIKSGAAKGMEASYARLEGNILVEPRQ